MAPIKYPMKIKQLFLLALLTSLAFGLFAQNTTEKNFAFAQHQARELLNETEKAKKASSNPALLSPRSLSANGDLVIVAPKDWCSGFFAGNLWFLYEYTGDEAWKQNALPFTRVMETEQTNAGTHDMGFKVYNSVGNAWRLTHDPEYKNVIIQSAKTLITRFNPAVGCLRSWDNRREWKFPVIIDNMMNLELLFFGSKVTGDPRYKNIAVTHALNVMKNQIRPDYSCYHVVCYDSLTGKVLSKETAQGYANNSTWSRGQAWGIYGFTMTYRETKDKRFLVTAQKMADYYLDNKELPADKVAYWDFYANNAGYLPGVRSHAKETPAKYRDASAAAITASALLELSTYLGNQGEKYKEGGIAILHALSSPAYKAAATGNGDFILKHSVGSIAHGVEIDVPLVYADYYFLEALNRYRLLLDHKNMIAGDTKNPQLYE